MLVQSLNVLLGELSAGSGWRWGGLVGLSERRRLFHRALGEALRLPREEIAEPLSETWERLHEPAVRRHLAAHCRLVYRDAALAERLLRNAQALMASFWVARAALAGDRPVAERWAAEAAGRLDPGAALPALPEAWQGLAPAERLEALVPWTIAPQTRLWVQHWASQVESSLEVEPPPCVLPVAGYQERLGGLLFDLHLSPVAGCDRLLEHPELALMPINGDLLEALEAARRRCGQGLIWRLVPRGETEVEVLRGCSLGGAAQVGCLALREGRRLDPGCLVIAAVEGERLLPTEHEQAKLAAGRAGDGITRIVLPRGAEQASRTARGAGPRVDAAATIGEAAALAATPPPELRLGLLGTVTGRLTVVAASVLLALAASWLGGTRRAAYDGAYVLTELGTLGARWSRAADLNDRGQVVGMSHNGQEWQAFCWSEETSMVGLAAPSERSSAVAINERGQICGWAGPVWHCEAIVWEADGAVRRLGNLGKGDYSAARDINERGQVVGIANDAIKCEAFLWDGPRGMAGLGPGLGYTAPAAVNDEGVIAFCTSPSSFQDWQPRLWHPDTGVRVLPDLGGGDTSVTALNNRGQAVGDSHNGRRREAVMWQPDGALVRLGTLYDLPSGATAINDAGTVVGYISGRCGFVWNRRTGMHDINRLLADCDAGYTVLMCAAINNRGQIVGTAQNAYGDERAVLLTPVARITDRGAEGEAMGPLGFTSETTKLAEWIVRASGWVRFGPSRRHLYAGAVVQFKNAKDRVDHAVVPVGGQVKVYGRRLQVFFTDELCRDNAGALNIEVRGQDAPPTQRVLAGAHALLADETRFVSFARETSSFGVWEVEPTGRAWYEAWWRIPYESAVVEYEVADGRRAYAVAPLGRPCRVSGRRLRVILVDDGPGNGRGRLDVTVRSTTNRRAWRKRIESPVPDQEPESN